MMLTIQQFKTYNLRFFLESDPIFIQKMGKSSSIASYDKANI